MKWLALIGPEVEENLSLRYLASSLSAAGFNSEIYAFNRGEDLNQVLASITSAPTPPLAVAISLAFQWRALDSFAIAMALRERAGYKGHITAGGHFGTFAAAEILRDFPEIDSICCHEAEETLVELAEALSNGEPPASIAGIAVRGVSGFESTVRKAPDLAKLPWPDRRGNASHCLDHRIAAMVASRGCYGNCAFCCIAAWHEKASPGKRYRLRPVEDIANEMAWLHKEMNRDIFIFHDDNFFLPEPDASLERINSLADALEARNMSSGEFAIVVKARPNDVTREVFSTIQERLGCIRVFLGIENDSDQGLLTLRRRVSRSQNHEAMALLADLGMYVCFNLLVFDPDATLESLETNIAFMNEHSGCPYNFGRVELYAGTPLLKRMQSENRCRGDYLKWNYSLANPEIERAFEIFIRCFYSRNFADGSLANRLMGTRFDVEVSKFFHPDLHRAEWEDRIYGIVNAFTTESVFCMSQIVRFVRENGPDAPASKLVTDLCERLRNNEMVVSARADELEQTIRSSTCKTCKHWVSSEQVF